MWGIKKLTVFNTLTFKDSAFFVSLVFAFAVLSGFFFYSQVASHLKDNFVQKSKLYQASTRQALITQLATNDKIHANMVLKNTLLSGDIIASVLYDKQSVLMYAESPSSAGIIKSLTTYDTEGFKEDYYLSVGEFVVNKAHTYKLFLLLNQRKLSDFLDDLVYKICICSISLLVLLTFLVVSYNRERSKIIEGMLNAVRSIAYSASFSVSYQPSNRKGAISQLSRSLDKMIEKCMNYQQEQIKYREALKASEEKYKHIFRTSLVGIFRYELGSHQFVEANSKLLAIFQVSSLEELNMLLVRNNRFKKLLSDIEKTTITEEREIEIQIKQKTVWLAISSVHYTNERFIDGIIDDITKSKETLSKLSESNEELDTFIYHASHDLRSPLKSVLGLTELMQKEPSEAQKAVYMKMIIHSVQRLDKFVGNMLTHTRNERGDSTLAAIDFNKEIAFTLDSLAFMPEMVRIKPQVQVRQSELFLSDPLRISIILNNLLSNAAKYQKVYEQNPLLKITVSVENDLAIIEVEDNGEGIHEASLGQLFKMFSRQTETSEGAGLGLYIVHNTVKKLKGKITASSKYGHGSIFRVEIPNFRTEDQQDLN